MLGILFLAATLASATTIVPTGVDNSRGASVWIKEDGADTQAYFAGVIFISLYDDGQQYDRDTLCVDLFTDIFLGVTYNSVVLSPSEVPGKNLPRVSWLVDNALLPTQDSSYISELPSFDWVASPAQGAGIQLAIWDIVHDGGDGFLAGRVQAAAATDPTILFWADTYRTLSAGHSSNLAYIYNNTDPSTGLPAQMLAGPRFTDGGPTPNPEPSTLVLAGAALTLLGHFARRKMCPPTAG
jgi:hypothetical protein